jgi:hypothetical protein
VDRSLVAVACYRAWAQLGPRGPLSLLHASDASWDAADDESIPTLALIERVRVQQLVGKHAEAAATLGVVLDREDRPGHHRQLSVLSVAMLYQHAFAEYARAVTLYYRLVVEDASEAAGRLFGKSDLLCGTQIFNPTSM